VTIPKRDSTDVLASGPEGSSDPVERKKERKREIPDWARERKRRRETSDMADNVLN